MRGGGDDKLAGTRAGSFCPCNVRASPWGPGSSRPVASDGLPWTEYWSLQYQGRKRPVPDTWTGRTNKGYAPRLKEALLNREIIDVSAGRVSILDPLFAHWLRTDYFRW